MHEFIKGVPVGQTCLCSAVSVGRDQVRDDLHVDGAMGTDVPRPAVRGGVGRGGGVWLACGILGGALWHGAMELVSTYYGRCRV